MFNTSKDVALSWVKRASTTAIVALTLIAVTPNNTAAQAVDSVPASPADSADRVALMSPLKSALRRIAMAQEAQLGEAGEYSRSIEKIITPWLPSNSEVAHFNALDAGWSAILKNAYGECGMYYGRIESPGPYLTEKGTVACILYPW